MHLEFSLFFLWLLRLICGIWVNSRSLSILKAFEIYFQIVLWKYFSDDVLRSVTGCDKTCLWLLTSTPLWFGEWGSRWIEKHIMLLYCYIHLCFISNELIFSCTAIKIDFVSLLSFLCDNSGYLGSFNFIQSLIFCFMVSSRRLYIEWPSALEMIKHMNLYLTISLIIHFF